MRLWSGLGLLALLQVASASIYWLEGHCNKVSADDVRGIENNRGAFLPSEETIKKTLLNDLSLTEFFVEKFKIHDHSPMKTVTFTAYFSVDLSRSEILEKIKKSSNNIFLLLVKIDSLPPAPDTDATSQSSQNTTTCLNGGVLLPNSECHCQPFYGGRTCGDLQCQNYGFIADLSSSDQCTCPPGIYGRACESKGCMPIVLDTVNDNLKTFSLVINQVDSMLYTINEVIRSFQKFMNPSITYQSYKLTYYIRNENITSVITISTQVFENFLKAVGGLTVLPVNPDDPYQEHSLAITQNQQTGSFSRGLSPIYVFASYGEANATGTDYHFGKPNVETLATLTTLSWRNRVLFVYNLLDGEDEELYNESHNSIRRLVKSILGDLVFIRNGEIDSILQDFAPVYSYNEVSAARYAVTNFKENEKIYFDGRESFLVTIEPDGKLPKLTDDAGNPITSTSVGQYYILLSAQTLSGVTTMTVEASSPWSYKKIHSDFHITSLITFTDDETVDVGKAYLSPGTTKFATGIQLGVSGKSVLSLYDYNTGSTVTQSLASSVRPICSFSLLFDTSDFQCTPGSVGIQILTPSNGYNYIRIVPALCAVYDQTSIPFVCQNNGTLNADGKSCTCLKNYSGDHCEIVSCQNGGTQVPYSLSCLCPRGYSGPLCSEVECSSKSADSFDYSSKSLALVMQNSFSQKSLLPKVVTGIHTMLLSIAAADAFADYRITTFNENTYTNSEPISSNHFTNASAFEDSLSNTQYYFTNSSNQPSLAALTTTVENVSPRSSVYLFVDSAPEVDTVNEIAKIIIEKQVQLTVIITPPFNLSDKCMLPSDRAVYSHLVTLTGGIIMNLCNAYEPTSKDPVVQLLSTAGSVTHRVENIEVGYSPNCNLQVQFKPSQFPSKVYIFINSDITDQFIVTIDAIEGLLSPLEVIPFVGFYSPTIQSDEFLGFNLNIEPKIGSSVGECSVRITEESQLAATMSFVPDPSFDSFTRSPFYGTPSNPVIHLSSVLQEDPQLTMTINDLSGAQLFQYEGLRRDECNYEYYFPAFACNNLYNEFTTSLTIKIGNTEFQRSNRAFCYLRETQCLNGGTFNNSTGKCDCSSQFNGIRCERPICLNGGGATIFYSCSCEAGYTGRFCEYITCPNPDYIDKRDLQVTEYRQVIFAINLHRSQLPVFVYLKSILQSFMLNNWISLSKPVQYSLITFTKTDVSNVISTLDKDRFLDAFNSLSHSFIDTTDGPTNVADALSNAYSIIDRPPGQVFLFTGYDSKNPTVGLTSFVTQIMEGTTNIFFTPMNPNLAYPTTLPMIVPVKITGGRSLKLGPYDAAALLPLLSTSMRENALLLDDGNEDCSGGYKFTFDLENEAREVILTITGSEVVPSNVVVTDGKSNVVEVGRGYTVLFNNYNNLIISINNTAHTIGGHWQVRIQVDSACNLQVRADSPTNVYLGYANSIGLDNVKQYPFMRDAKNKTAFLAFRSSATLSDLALYKSDPYYPWQSKSEGDQQYDTANVYTRDAACSYQYITKEITFDSATFQKLIVYGLDSNNNQFHRSFSMFLRKSSPSITCKFGTRDENYGFCTCDDQHEGPTCSDPICQNGGTPSLGICVCSVDFYGRFCEKYFEETMTSTSPVVQSTSGSSVSPGGSTTFGTTGLTDGSSSMGSTVSPGVPSTSGGSVSPGGSTTFGTTGPTDGSSSLGSTVSPGGSTTFGTTGLTDGSSSMGSTVSPGVPSTSGGSVSPGGSTTFGTTGPTDGSSSLGSTVSPGGSTTFGTTGLTDGSSSMGSTVSPGVPSTSGSSVSPGGSTAFGTTGLTDGSSSLGSTVSPGGSTTFGTAGPTDGSSSMGSTVSPGVPSTTGSSVSPGGSTAFGTTGLTDGSSSMGSTVSPGGSTTFGTAGPTDGSSSMGSTVTCDPTTSPIFMSFFLDIAQYATLNSDGQGDVTIHISELMKLGTNIDETIFWLSGVGDSAYHQYRASDITQVKDAIQSLDSFDTGAYDLSATVNHFLSSGASPAADQRSFAIIMQSFDLGDSSTKDVVENAIVELKDRGYQVLGVADKENSELCKTLTQNNCFYLKKNGAQDVAQQIVDQLCSM